MLRSVWVALGVTITVPVKWGHFFLLFHQISTEVRTAGGSGVLLFPLPETHPSTFFPIQFPTGSWGTFQTQTVSHEIGVNLSPSAGVFFFFLMAMFASQQLPSLMFFRYQLLAPNILLAADQFIFHSLLHLSRDRNRYVLLCFLIALFLVKKSPCFIKVLYRQRESRGEGEGAAVLVGSINSHLPLALL